MLIYLCLIFGLLILILYINFKKRYCYWKRLNVPYLEPSFPMGNVPDFLKSDIHFSYVLLKLYKRLKANKAGHYAGIYFFGNPILLVLTPEFAKTVLVKDFQYFTDRGIYYNDQADPLSGNLFFLRGTKWKELREKLTPTFTSGKLKQMFSTILDVGINLQHNLEPHAHLNEDIEIREILARFMTDVIASTAFGLNVNSLENPNSEFRKMGRKMLNFPKSKALKLIMATSFQSLARQFGVRWNDKDVSDFFINVVHETITYREENGIKRNDFMQLLIDMKCESNIYSTTSDDVDDSGLTFLEIAAQAFVFFFAGFETSSTTMTFALHLLAHNPDIQERARVHINSVLDNHNGEWCYSAIGEMNYIEQIVEETLRMYPPAGDIHRWTVKDYLLPNGATLPRDQAIIIPNLAMSRDADYFPNPMKFDPDRFTPEAKLSRHPFCTLPFGEGPRICIGMRFGLMQTKLGLAMLLHKFRFNVCERTDNPIKIDTVNLFHAPAGEVWLNIDSV